MSIEFVKCKCGVRFEWDKKGSMAAICPKCGLTHNPNPEVLIPREVPKEEIPKEIPKEKEANPVVPEEEEQEEYDSEEQDDLDDIEDSPSPVKAKKVPKEHMKKKKR